eukprot:1136127-Pelagomonas_calceolata.AAC.1
MGMGKSAADALPELRRKGITANSPHRFVLNGITMSAPEVAEALRLQVLALMCFFFAVHLHTYRCAAVLYGTSMGAPEVAEALRLQVLALLRRCVCSTCILVGVQLCCIGTSMGAPEVAEALRLQVLALMCLHFTWRSRMQCPTPGNLSPQKQHKHSHVCTLSKYQTKTWMH